VVAGRRSDGMALFGRLYHFAGLVGSHEAIPATSAAKTAASPNSIRPSVCSR
jgi:hypothetical protein